MTISHDTLDDLMHDVLSRLVCTREEVKASRGSFTELFGCCLHLKNPRARLSRSEGKGKIFSALGELMWYLSTDTRLDFIEYYVTKYRDESDDGSRVRSGYGDRLFNYRGVNQVGNVVRLLRERPTSRRAVVQLFDATDLDGDYASVPCTCALQFLVRSGRLNMFVSMRSNDAYIGLPHDVFAFTMIQEIVARSVGVEVGEYKHCAGSLHLYEEHRAAAKAYLEEGWQASIPMPPMPDGDPWASIQQVRTVEEAIRLGTTVDAASLSLDEYWLDLIRLLQAFRASKDKEGEVLTKLLHELSSQAYTMFIQARIDQLSSLGTDTREG